MTAASPSSESPAPVARATQRWPSVFVASCAGVIAYCVIYVVADYARWPKLFHDQVERRFFIATEPGGPGPAGWPGLWLWALAAGVAGVIVAMGVQRLRRGRVLSPRAEALLGAWAMAAFVLAGAYFSWNNRP